MRVPTPNVSLVELVFCTKKNINKENINKSFELASKNNLKNVLEITHEKLVSIDFNHNPASAIVDGSLTMLLETIWVKFQPGMIMNGVFKSYV